MHVRAPTEAGDLGVIPDKASTLKHLLRHLHENIDILIVKDLPQLFAIARIHEFIYGADFGQEIFDRFVEVMLDQQDLQESVTPLTSFDR